MKKLTIVLAGLALSGIAVAAPSTYIEGALIDGGDNGRNGGSDQAGLEVAGSFSFGNNWYVGGALGRFNRDLNNSGEIKNTYFNLNGGRSFPVGERTDLITEVGLWLGEEKLSGTSSNYKTDPSALELKAGINHALSDKLGLFGTLSWVGGDLDTSGNDDLRNYVWSLGGAYNFSSLFSLNLKMVNGVNGVNGQDEVLRLGARWTF